VRPVGWCPTAFTLALVLCLPVIAPAALEHLQMQFASHINNPDPAHPLVLSLHGQTGTGKTYSVQLIEESIFTKRCRSNVHKFAGSRYSDPAQMRVYVQQFERQLRDAVKSCHHSVFIWDEAHLMVRGIMDALRPFFDQGAMVDKVRMFCAARVSVVCI
jgi:hypothetical protein